MLRRLRVWFARLFGGQAEHERLGRLLTLLRANGVTHYRTAQLRLDLAPPEAPERHQGTLPGQRLVTDNEILFGETEESLRKQGLI